MENKPKIMGANIPIVKMSKEKLKQIEEENGVTLNPELFL